MSTDTSEHLSNSGNQIAAIIYMSGDRRGVTELLGQRISVIRLEGRFGVRIGALQRGLDPDAAAILRPSENTFELEVTPGWKVWVNGVCATKKKLASGDVLEIGRNGPMLRFKKYADAVIPRRTTHDVYCDCVDCARFGQGALARKTGLFVGGIANEFMIRTTVVFRLSVLLTLAAIIAGLAFLVQKNVALEERVARGEAEMLSLSVLIEQTEGRAITREDFLAMRAELAGDISTAIERVEALELRSGAAARVVSAASQSVIFIQGAYSFIHSETGQFLRYSELGSAQKKAPALQGGRAVTLGGEGPLVEMQYTGTGFFVTDDGLVITSRHVAQPWKEIDFTAVAATMGLTPFIYRLIGYQSGAPEPFDLTLIDASVDADVAVLRRKAVPQVLPFIRVSNLRPKPGDEVIVLGYPTGVRAMLARTDQQFLDALQAKEELDFWNLGQQLAQSGYIRPLATRGIVGQVTPSAVVYDAETAQGGSGGPVLNLDGFVIAVNTAVLKEFGGSNLGVPIAHVSALLKKVDTTE